MYQFKDISRLTRIGIVALWIYLVTGVLVSARLLYSTMAGSLSAEDAQASLIPVGVDAIVFLLTSLVICRWIYRASANAHVLAPDLPISAGGAVGWFFVPIATLWKPFEAMKQTWLASHFGENWPNGDTSDSLKWWWGLWLLFTVLSNIAWRVSDPQWATNLELAKTIVTIPLSLLLIRIMKHISEAQSGASRYAQVFA